MTGDGFLTHADVATAYARWAPIYDLVFSVVMRNGRRAVADALSAGPGRVLDVGVGTGLELPMFRGVSRIVGVDLSEPMLRRCKDRIHSLRLHRVDGLAVMDAMQLAFADSSFESVVAPFVLTVAPDPSRMLDELARVVKPSGQIVMVNHIGAESGLMAWIENLLARRSASLGWRPSFPWSIVANWLASRQDVRLIERRTLSPLGLFTLIRLTKD